MKPVITITVFIFSLMLLGSLVSNALSPDLPEDIKDYKKWTRLNKKIIKPRVSDAHEGFKKVYANLEKEDLIDSNNNLTFPYPEGTLIVKEVKETRKPKSKIVLISIMRKQSGNETTGGWDFEEFSSSDGKSFSKVLSPKESCYACHEGASDSDSVWTKFDRF